MKYPYEINGNFSFLKTIPFINIHDIVMEAEEMKKCEATLVVRKMTKEERIKYGVRPGSPVANI